MWDTLMDWPGWGGVGYGAAWLVTGCLIVVGIAGCILPFLPGHLILILAAVGHRLMLGRADSGVEWWTFVVLTVLAIISQTLEFFSGAVGARWFGGTRWGAAGALIGGIVGIFFMPFGLLLGPLAGAFLFEWCFAKKEMRPATVSGVGSVAGTLAGMVIKFAIGIAMVLYFLIDVFWI